MVESTSPATPPPPAPRKRRRTPLIIRILRWAIVFAMVFIMFALTGCLERLAYMPAGGTPPPPAEAEEVWFTSEDGTRLHGWYFVATHTRYQRTPPSPPITPPTPAPTILVVHGNAGNIDTHHGFVEYLPNAGFNVLLFDYRGYGNSDPGHLRRHNLRADTEAALDYLLSRPELKDSPIFMYAQSIGVTFGLDVMAEREEIRAAVIMSAFTRWQDMAAVTLGGKNPGAIARFMGRMLMPAGLDPIDSITRVGDRPILSIHGKDDEIIPYSHGEAVVQAAQDAGVPITFRTVIQGDHNSLRWIDSRIDQEIIAFFQGAHAVAGP